MASVTLPVLDVSTFDGPSQDAFVSKLRDAAHGPGFCYVEGHGIETQLESALLAAARTFSHLPEEDRRSIAIGQSSHFRGLHHIGR